jgi:hypothetical protein
VLECEDDRNKKSALCCEEAVEDRDSLWKAKEKTVKFFSPPVSAAQPTTGNRLALIRRNSGLEA